MCGASPCRRAVSAGFAASNRSSFPEARCPPVIVLPRLDQFQPGLFFAGCDLAMSTQIEIVTDAPIRVSSTLVALALAVQRTSFASWPACNPFDHRCRRRNTYWASQPPLARRPPSTRHGWPNFAPAVLLSAPAKLSGYDRDRLEGHKRRSRPPERRDTSRQATGECCGPVPVHHWR
jgi:hypothetical protein